MAGPDSGCDSMIAMFYFCNTQAISTMSLVVKMLAFRHLQWGYSSWRLLLRVTVASAAASAILNFLFELEFELELNLFLFLQGS